MKIKILFFCLFLPVLVLSQEINYTDLNGLKQGIWKKTYDNGSIRYEGQFINNNPTGIFFYYFQDGALKAEKNFFLKGHSAAHFFYETGSLKAAGLYINNQKDSTWNYYNRDSVLILSEEYKSGKLHGKTKTYYDADEESSDGFFGVYEIKNWNNGLQEGIWEQYFLDGTLKMQSTFNSGKREGKHLFFYPDGSLSFEGNYKEDKKAGKWIYYNISGEIDTILYFNNE
ncbi:MAG: hypothetical protein VX370_00770 [Bacteroidota bacterium]|nr:hypothetical protein [Bacteroidota bacterium]